MKIQPFKIERYYAPYEFTAEHHLSPSDCESLSKQELLELADVESIKLWDNLSLGYTETQGHPELRSQIAELYDQIQAQNIMVAAPEECIFLTMQTLLNAGDHMIAVFPSYQSSYEIARSIGCNLSFWEADEASGWAFDINKLEALIKPETKLLYINFPHNPTAKHINRQELEAIVAIAKKHDLILFSDEMYRLSEHDPTNRLPSVCDLYEKGIVLFGMSKSFGLSGLRVGWLATKQTQWIEQCLTMKDYTTICNSAPSEILALMGLRAKDQILKRNLDIIRANLQVVDGFFEQYQDLFSWHKPIAGTFGFTKLLFEQSSSDFCRDLIENAGILFVPSSMFNYGEQHIRLGFGRRNLKDGLEAFTDYLDKHYR